jgi:hypothetical protein
MTTPAPTAVLTYWGYTGPTLTTTTPEAAAELISAVGELRNRHWFSAGWETRPASWSDSPEYLEYSADMDALKAAFDATFGKGAAHMVMRPNDRVGPLDGF